MLFSISIQVTGLLIASLQNTENKDIFDIMNWEMEGKSFVGNLRPPTIMVTCTLYLKLLPHAPCICVHVNRTEFASMVMERVASEYNKLQYNVSHVNGHPLVEEMTPRIAHVTATLQNHLQDTFRSSLEHKDREKLIQSLQTYSSIGRQSAAEEMFQNVIALPYMEKVSFFY